MKIDRYPDIESNGGLTSSIHQSARNSTASIFICTRLSGLLSRQAIPHTAQLIILVTNWILMFLMTAVISVKGAFVENKSCYMPCLIVCECGYETTGKVNIPHPHSILWAGH